MPEIDPPSAVLSLQFVDRQTVSLESRFAYNQRFPTSSSDSLRQLARILHENSISEARQTARSRDPYSGLERFQASLRAVLYHTG